MNSPPPGPPGGIPGPLNTGNSGLGATAWAQVKTLAAKQADARPETISQAKSSQYKAWRQVLSAA